MQTKILANIAYHKILRTWAVIICQMSKDTQTADADFDQRETADSY